MVSDSGQHRRILAYSFVKAMARVQDLGVDVISL
jgi:hypothetical protein